MKIWILCVLFIANAANAQSWTDLYGCYQTVEHNGQKVLASRLNITKVEGAISFTFLDLNSKIIPIHRFKIYNSTGFDYVEIFQTMGKHKLDQLDKEFSFYDLLRYGYASEQVYHVDSYIEVRGEREKLGLTVKNIVSEAGSLNLNEQYVLQGINCP